MPKPLAERVSNLKPSLTVEMTEQVRLAKAAGRKLIAMSSGDPNLATDPRIIDAAEASMRRGNTRYGPPQGFETLREAIVQREELLSGAHYAIEDIIVTPGGKFALLTALMAIVEPGDEVLVPEPGWVSYGPCVRLCQGQSVLVPSLGSFDIAAYARAVTPRTKAIIVNSPSNPTGGVIGPEQMAALVDLCERHDLWIIFDQVYCDLCYVTPFATPQATPEGQRRTFVIDSFSKTYGMTGWRLGYIAMPKGLSKFVIKFIQHSVYCVPGFVQDAGTLALSLHDELAPKYRDMFRQRQQRAAHGLAAIPGIECRMPDATFYMFAKIAGDDVATAKLWLDQGDIACLPGSAFGAAGAGHLRFSMTCSDEELDTALLRIAQLGVVRSA